MSGRRVYRRIARTRRFDRKLSHGPVHGRHPIRWRCKRARSDRVLLTTSTPLKARRPRSFRVSVLQSVVSVSTEFTLYRGAAYYSFPRILVETCSTSDDDELDDFRLGFTVDDVSDASTSGKAPAFPEPSRSLLVLFSSRKLRSPSPTIRPPHHCRYLAPPHPALPPFASLCARPHSILYVHRDPVQCTRGPGSRAVPGICLRWNRYSAWRIGGSQWEDRDCRSQRIDTGALRARGSRRREAAVDENRKERLCRVGACMLWSPIRLHALCSPVLFYLKMLSSRA